MLALNNIALEATQSQLEDVVADCTPIDLLRPTLSTESMLLSRQIGRVCKADLPELGGAACLSLELASPMLADCDWTDNVVLTGPFGTIEVAQGGRLLRAMTGIDLGEAEYGNTMHCSWLQAATLGRLNATPFSCVTQLARSARAEPCSESVLLYLTLTSSVHRFSVYVRASAVAWRHFLTLTPWRSELGSITPFLHLPGNVAVRVARHSMPSAVLATLVAGDIILPQQAYFLANGEGSLRWGGKLARVRYRAPSELIIIDLEDSMDLPQWDTQDDSAATVFAAVDGQADALALDSMPVTLDFEMGKAQLSLGELRTLAAGAIVLIKGGSPAALTIRSAGSILGRGELVDVSGQLAIRVTQWGPRL